MSDSNNCKDKFTYKHIYKITYKQRYVDEGPLLIQMQQMRGTIVWSLSQQILLKLKKIMIEQENRYINFLDLTISRSLIKKIKK